MKKAILPLTMLALAGTAFAQQAAVPQEKNIEVGAKFAYESHYVNRGIDQSDSNLQTTVNVGVGGYNSGYWALRAYGELAYMSPVSDEGNEADWTLGARANYADEYFLDFGYRFKSYPNGGVEHAYSMRRAYVNRSNELFLKVGRDVEFVTDEDWSRIIISGSVSYDWNLEQTTWEVSAEKTFESIFTNETDFAIGVTYGYITANDWVGDQLHGVGDPNNDYGYLTVKADLIYHLNTSTDLSFGVRYSYNNDHDRYIHGARVMSIDCNTFWWGVSLNFCY